VIASRFILVAQAAMEYQVSLLLLEGLRVQHQFPPTQMFAPHHSVQMEHLAINSLLMVAPVAQRVQVVHPVEQVAEEQLHLLQSMANLH
jgi:hypothetical protein